MEALLPFGNPQVIRRASQLNSGLGANTFLLGVDLLGYGNLFMRKKLFRSLAGDSTPAVIMPINTLHGPQRSRGGPFLQYPVPLVSKAFKGWVPERFTSGVLSDRSAPWST